ncbi:MAG: tetratricopeptide repeat protein [Thiothrix sp.]
MKTRATHLHLLALCSAISLLSACAPNPTVLQDRVYGMPSVQAPNPRLPNSSIGQRNTPAVIIAAPQPKQPVTSVALPKPAPRIPVESPKEEAPTPEPRQQQAVQSSPAVLALMRQANGEADAGNLDKAADTLERALRIEPRNPDLWLQLSAIKQRQGDNEQAAQMAAKAKAYQE